MADPIEMTALTSTTSTLLGDFLWLKRGVSDFKITIANLFSWHTDDSANPHGTTKTQVGLANVTNDAQLKIASNLSDLANAGTARTNLGVDSKVNTDANLAAHIALTNPHNLTLALLGYPNLQNYPISNSFVSNSSTQYASSKAVKDGLADLMASLEDVIHKKGDIIMWHGNKLAFEASDRYLNNIWRICDGTYNATYGGDLPNLVGRIPRGATGADTGAELGTDDNRHDHGVITLGHELQPSQLPEHFHEVRRLEFELTVSGSDRGRLGMTSFDPWTSPSPTLTGTTEVMKKFGGDTGASPIDGLLPAAAHSHIVSEDVEGAIDGNIPAVTEVHFIIKIQ